MNRKHLKIIRTCGTAWFAALFMACGTSYQIVDRTGATFIASKIHLSKQKDFIYLAGQSDQSVPISKILSMKINSNKMIHRDDKVYYQVEITLTSGNELKSSATRKDTTPSFISIEDFLYGKTTHGDFKISLKDVIEIKQVEIQ